MKTRNEFSNIDGFELTLRKTQQFDKLTEHQQSKKVKYFIIRFKLRKNLFFCEKSTTFGAFSLR